MYFVSVRWRNNLHVSPMRLFSSLDDAKAYAEELRKENLGDLVIYQLFSDKKPVKIKVD
jgi:hypothetical protein